MNRLISIKLFVLLTLVSSCAQKKDYVVTIKTDYGDMVAILFDDTPKHKENFVKLAKEGYYDSLMFHRVMQGFMIQGGDPNSKKAVEGQPLGTGGPGYQIDEEIKPNHFHKKGALAAARTPNPAKASSGSQFYIVQGTVVPKEGIDELKIDQAKLNQCMQQFMQQPENAPIIDSMRNVYYSGDMVAYRNLLVSLTPRMEAATGIKVRKEISPEMISAYTTIGGAPHLDGEYTVFGQVIKGIEVVDKIASQPTGASDRPIQDIRMKVTVEEMSRKKITKEYGYEYPQ